ncbi:efflux RND transporter periplasmic adaptor subunit [Eudoraea sp.]|uniref:efflux RND transporter periplasmic adaptor subunit n=1 Tax=Eudoraea sp. TaxID=1979955 RepID=UPI003C76B81C
MNTQNYLAHGALLITFLLLLGSCSDERKNNGKEQNKVAISVEVMLPKTISEDNTVSVSGKVSAVNTANLSTRIMGHVDNIYVNLGDSIRKGQLLLSINNMDLSAKLAQANAGVAEANAAFSNAEKDLSRYSFLFKEQSASQKELDDIEAQYIMAKSRLEASEHLRSQIQSQFSYSDIRAPFDGVVTNKFINEGDMASPGVSLLVVESRGKFEVQTMVSESEITKVVPGMKVEVLLKSLNKTISAEVIEVSSSSKNSGGQFEVRAILENTSFPIFSGMYATIKFPSETKNSENVPLIPLDAVIQRGELKGVYSISDNNTALLRWLRLGRVYGDEVEVLSGLKPEEGVIVSSEGQLYNGAEVLIK